MSVAVRRSYVDGPYGQMHVRMAAHRDAAFPPLLCIHMSPMTGRTFEQFMAGVGTDRTAVAFDTPGFGFSDAPPGPPEIDDYATALFAGLDALGIETCDIIGYHTGALIATAMANAAPKRVRRVIMIGAPIFPEDERKLFNAHYAHKAPDADGAHLAARWRGFLYHHLRPGTTIEDVADVFPDALLGRANEWWGHRAAFAFDLAGALKALAQPVLIWNCGDDLDVQTRRAAGLARNSEILEVPGWGHLFLDKHRDDAVALARRFLDAPDNAPFAAVTAPASALRPRYPAQVGSFAPD